MDTAATAAAAAADVPTRTFLRVAVELRHRLSGACLLRGETTMQIGEELLSRSITAQPRRLQIDGRPNLRGFEVVGPERLWATATQQVVDVPA